MTFPYRLPFDCDYCKTQYAGEETRAYCQNCGASLDPPRRNALKTLLIASALFGVLTSRATQ
jgi:hypothetical protein